MQKQKKRNRTGSSVATGSGRYVPVLSAILCICVVVTAVLWRTPSFRIETDDILEGQVAIVPCQKIGKLKYRDIAEKRTPLILTGTVADSWPARKAFTTAFLDKKLKIISAHRQEDKRSFITFHDDKPLEPLVLGEKWEDFNLKVNTTIAKILQWDNPQGSKDRGPYMYYSQDVATLKTQFPDILGYLQPLKPLILSDDNVQVNLWVGREGLVTHTHYDCTFNFFVQLQGKKRFTLFPPNQSLYLYPCLHPHYGHSQVDILSPDKNKFPKFTSNGGLIAEVSPGDMLVVPPFWFHHVETLSESISVNVWSDAPEYALLNQIYSLPVPFEEAWPWEDLVMATKVYIDMIIVSLNVSHRPSIFIERLLEQRYFPLVSSMGLKINQTLLEQLDMLCRQRDWRTVKERYENILSPGVKKLESLFRNIPIKDTMEICLMNYVEHLTYSIIGLDYIYPFLSNCAFE